MPRKKAAQTICPRCGLPVSYFEKHRSGDKEYLYAVHYYGYSRTASGKVKKKVRKCYLGPVGAYEYVINKGLSIQTKEGLDCLLEKLDIIGENIKQWQLDEETEALLERYTVLIYD